MVRKLVCAIALVPAFWLAPASAVGLGDVDVRSHLNQRFSAVIPVVDATPEDVESLSVRLASNADFERAGVDRSEYLTSLSFSLDPSGRSIVVSSKLTAREPLLNFIVEARWRGGRLLREYTVFLDPPGGGSTVEAPATLSTSSAQQAAPAAAVTRSVPPARPAAPAPAPAPVPVPAPAPTVEAAPAGPVAVPKPEKVETQPSVARSGGTNGSYGPVAPQETLWSIGTRVRPSPEVTMDQVLLALYETNPEAFVGGIGGLQKGVTLSVPDAARMQAVSAEEAKVRVARLRSGRPAQPAAAKASPVAAAAAVKTPVRATPPSAAPAAAPPAPKVKIAPAAATAPATPAPASTDAASVADRLAGQPTATAAPPATKTSSTSAAASEPKPTPATPVGPAAATPAPTGTAATASPVDGPTTAAAPPAASSTTAAATTTTAPATPAAAPAPVVTPAPTTPPPAASVTPAPVVAPAPAAAAGDQGLLDGLLIPILVIVLILLLIGLLLWRRRQAAVVEPPPTQLTPKANLRTAASIGAAAGAAAAVAAMPEEARSAPTPPSMLDTPDPLLDPPPARLPGTGLGAAKTLSEFERVAPSDARPLSVTLDSNDPLAEADFHLAYGLYDEAAALLKTAIAKNPERTALRVKLAETYNAANKPLEFLEAAESMQGKVSETEWKKVSAMGRELCPNASLFRAAGEAELPRDLDLSFDEPPAAVAAAPSAPVFSIADQPSVPAAISPSATAAAPGNAIDFDLEQELLKAPFAEPPSTPPAPAADTGLGGLDLSEFDLGSESTKKASDFNTIEFNLEELDLSKPAAAQEISDFGDEVGTKLDLARAYADMGDNEAARGLLDEVIASGSANQKQEAEALRKRLSV